MEKLLTVSVAAYNGAATLQKALESCLVADESLQALLDVIIIDDGSTDGTAALAQAFVQAHPGSFRLVSKVNGGYGSTLNTAVELASGRYFRTLDCDDWFDTNALQTLLRRLQNCTADAVYTNYRTVQENGSGKTFDWWLIGETSHPYFLAGGLNEENITRTAQTGAYALDLSSGIETDDTKDIDKMRRVAALVKGAHQ